MADQPDEEEVRGRKRPGNVMKGADTTFLYAESKAARFVEKYTTARIAHARMFRLRKQAEWSEIAIN